MFICLNCGNGIEFEIQAWVPVNIVSLSVPITGCIEIEFNNLMYPVRCRMCDRSDIRNLGHITPRQLINEIAHRHFRSVHCPVEAARHAKRWFKCNAPNLSGWLESEITGEVMVNSETFCNLQTDQVDNELYDSEMEGGDDDGFV